MYDQKIIEDYFNKFIQDLPSFLPEGVIQIDSDYLERSHLLQKRESPTSLTRYFNTFESQDKITLINDQFTIWIVPEGKDTLVLVALNHNGIPHLELAFVTSDTYISSKLILQILEKLLLEIQENEDSIKPYLSLN